MTPQPNLNAKRPPRIRICKKCSAPYQGRCKPCDAIRTAAYKAANVEKVRIQKAQYYAARAPIMPTRNAETRKRASQYYLAHSARILAYSAEWAAKNNSSRRSYGCDRRARKAASGGKLSPDLAKRLLILQRGKCACCGRKLGKDYHLDHIVPLALGGRNDDGNIQLLTKTCNLQKNAKDPVEFMQERGFLI